MDFNSEDEGGSWTGREGSHIKFSISSACAASAVFPVRARLTGRRERGSAEVGIASGIGSDILKFQRD